MTRMNMTCLSAAIAALSTALLLSTGIGQAAEKPQEDPIIMPDTARTVFQVQKTENGAPSLPMERRSSPLCMTASSPMQRVISSS